MIFSLSMQFFMDINMFKHIITFMLEPYDPINDSMIYDLAPLLRSLVESRFSQYWRCVAAGPKSEIAG